MEEIGNFLTDTEEGEELSNTNLAIKKIYVVGLIKWTVSRIFMTTTVYKSSYIFVWGCIISETANLFYIFLRCYILYFYQVSLTLIRSKQMIYIFIFISIPVFIFLFKKQSERASKLSDTVCKTWFVS